MSWRRARRKGLRLVGGKPLQPSKMWVTTSSPRLMSHRKPSVAGATDGLNDATAPRLRTPDVSKQRLTLSDMVCGLRRYLGNHLRLLAPYKSLFHVQIDVEFDPDTDVMRISSQS